MANFVVRMLIFYFNDELTRTESVGNLSETTLKSLLDILSSYGRARLIGEERSDSGWRGVFLKQVANIYENVTRKGCMTKSEHCRLKGYLNKLYRRVRQYNRLRNVKNKLVNCYQIIAWNTLVFLTFLFVLKFAVEISFDSMARLTGKRNWPWHCSLWLFSRSYYGCLML